MNMNYKQSLTFKRTILYIVMVIFALLAVVPIYLMLINATRSNAQINSGVSFLPGGNNAELEEPYIKKLQDLERFRKQCHHCFLLNSSWCLLLYPYSLWYPRIPL